MYHYIAAVMLLHCLSVTSSDCPGECECHTLVDSTHNVTCVTNNLVRTIRSLPLTVSCLLLQTGPDLPIDQRVFFNNLSELRILMLEYEAKDVYSHQIRIESDAFHNNSKLEIFRNRLRAEWIGVDHFVHNHDIEEIMISQSTMDWSYFSGLATKSLANKRKLTTLRLRYFTVESDLKIVRAFSLKSIFGALKNIPIKHLDLASNGIHQILPEWNEVFWHLEYLDISFNMICYPTSNTNPYTQIWPILLFNPVLKYFDFGHQGNYEAFTARGNIQNFIVSPSPPITISKTPDLYNKTNPCECDLVPLPLSNLHFLGAAELDPMTFPQGMTSRKYTCLCFAPNKLTHLDISSNSLAFDYFNFLEKLLIINLNSLRILNMQNCGFKMLSEQFFSLMPELQSVFISENSLGTFMDAKSDFYFINNSRLQVLDLAKNNIREFPTGSVLKDLGELTYLNLSDNHLSSWNTDIHNLIHLVNYNLSGNRFTTVSEFFRDQLENLTSQQKQDLPAGEKLTIDLSRNPLSCLCGDLRFISWMQATKINFFNKENYTCVHPEFSEVNLQNVDLDHLDKYCLPNPWIHITIAISVSIAGTLVVVALVIMHCKRWHLRYWWYMLHKGWRRFQDEEDETNYQYDVFVAHNTEDAEWVTGPLFDELETKRGLRLCLYQRDILPNEVLVQAIVEKISMSRRTLLVLSPNFVASNWCHFELHIAHSKLCEEGKDVIVSVILKELPNIAINETLYKLLKRKVYLEWPSERGGEELFWTKLASALTPPVEAFGASTPARQ